MAYAGFPLLILIGARMEVLKLKMLLNLEKKLGITFINTVMEPKPMMLYKLVNFISNTDDNGKPKFCNIDLKKINRSEWNQI